MKRLLNLEIIKLIVRIIPALVFIFFAVVKIENPAEFAHEIGNYKLFPIFSINLIAIILPWVELILGFMLLAGIKIRSTVFFTGVLLLGFILAVAGAMAQGLDISCGCSGHNSPKVGLPKILENTALLILCIQTFLNPESKYSLSASSIR